MSIPDAIVALTVAAVPGAIKYEQGMSFSDDDLMVFDRIILPTPPRRYIRINPDNGTRAALSVCGRSDSATYRWQTDCWAPDGQMASWMAERLLEGVLDVRLTVAGWSCGPIGHTFSQSPGPEESVMSRPVVRALDQFALLASRTA